MKYQEFTPVDLSTFSDEQLALVNAALEPRSPEMWRDIAELVFMSLRCVKPLAGITDPHLADAAVAVVYQIMADYGGSAPYFPKGQKIVAAATAQRVLSQYRGNNLLAVARNNKLTTNRVRQIVEEQDTKTRLSKSAPRPGVVRASN